MRVLRNDSPTTSSDEGGNKVLLKPFGSWDSEKTLQGMRYLSGTEKTDGDCVGEGHKQRNCHYQRTEYQSSWELQEVEGRRD